MPNNIVEIHTSANKEEMSPGQVVTAGEGTGFDTVTERWYFGAGGIPATYLPGGTGKPTGYNLASLYCMGPSDVERLPGAQKPVIATITWRGLLASNVGISTGTETYSTRETSYDSMTYIPGVPSPTTTRRARLIDIVPGYSLRSIHLNQKPQRPKPNGGKFPAPPGAPTFNAQDQITVWSAVETYVYPNGWIPVSWQCEEVLPGIWFLSAEYRFEFDKVFG